MEGQHCLQSANASHGQPSATASAPTSSEEMAPMQPTAMGRKRQSESSSSQEERCDSRPVKKVRKMRKSMDREGAGASSSDEGADDATDNGTSMAEHGGERSRMAVSAKKKNMRRNIRGVIAENQMDDQTKSAQSQEQDRLRRLFEQQQQQRKKLLQEQFLRDIQERRLQALQDLQKRQQELIDLEADEAGPELTTIRKRASSFTRPIRSDSDVLVLSSDGEKGGNSGSEIEEVPIEVENENDENDNVENAHNSGMHIDDRLNVPDSEGRVQVNLSGPSAGEDPIYLAPQLSRVVKPHQIGGIRFLYDNIIESGSRYGESEGFGCILAHSMGLGKTIQLVSFTDIFLRHTQGRHVLCIVPINTIQNWNAEFNQWTPSAENVGGKFKRVPSPEKELDNVPSWEEGAEFLDESEVSRGQTGGQTGGQGQSDEVRPRNFQIHILNDACKNLESRKKVIMNWRRTGGVLLMGYELYRQLANKKAKKPRKNAKTNKKGKKGYEVVDLEEEEDSMEAIHSALINPGPDLVICDEGHRIKNSHASISQALKSIRTKRRIVLTGYPLQNNLLEYWCMVDFVRPNFLGNKTEFSNMFERPIQNGQCVDSTPKDVRLMMHRAHVLHTQLKGFVQRRDHSVLRASLPPKNEHVLLLRMTSTQRRLYSTFMDELTTKGTIPNPLKAFAVCCKIWNHPDNLFNHLKLRELQTVEEIDLDIEEVSAVVADKGKKGGKFESQNRFNSPQTGLVQGGPGFNPFAAAAKDSRREEINYDWAKPMMSSYVEGLLENSAKFQVFFSILENTVKSGDRLLLFSQSLGTLNLLEQFLSQRLVPGTRNHWRNGRSYYRLDGSTPAQERERLINAFNARPDVPLFLVSTKAGSLGVNLVGANRVVVFDASWNPCHDSQAVCRVYRYGQQKISHIYRLVSDNSVEKRIYDRQVNKQGMADRVVDEQNPDNHLSSKEIHTLICDNEKDPAERMDFSHLRDASSPFDPVLTQVLQDCGGLLTATPFAHESLLVDRTEKRLSKAEKRLAERSYAMERTSHISYSRPSYAAFYPSAGTSATNLNQPGSSGLTRQRYNHTAKTPVNVKRPEPKQSVLAPHTPQFNSLQWLGESRPVASVRPMTSNQQGRSRSPTNIQEEGASGPVPISSILKTTYDQGQEVNGVPKPCGNSFLDPRNRVVSNLPTVGVATDYKASGSKAFPMEALSKKKGVSINEWTVPSDMVIPTRDDGKSPVTLKAGQRVHLIKTPKGMYLRMGDSIIKIRIPEAMLADTMQPQHHQAGHQARAPKPASKSEVVTLSDSSSSSEENNGDSTNGGRFGGSQGSSMPQSSSNSSSPTPDCGSRSPVDC